MNSRERILAALSLEKVDKIPWIELGFHGKIAGEIIGEEMVLNTGFHPLEDPDEYRRYLLQTVKLSKKIGLDALHLKCWAPVYTFVETITGTKVYKETGKIKDEEELEKLRDEFLENCKEARKKILRCAEIFNGIMARENIARGYDIGGVFTESWRCMGMENFSISLLQNPMFAKKVISFFDDFYNNIVEEIISRFDVDFIWSVDDLAFKTGTFISLGHFREFILPYFRRTKEIIGHIPWILHCDGNFLPFMDDLISVGIKAFQPIEPLAIDIIKVKETYGRKICPVGNLDLNLIEKGTPQEVRSETEKLIEKLGFAGYIFSSGNSITEWAKTENVLVIADVLRKKTNPGM